MALWLKRIGLVLAGMLGLLVLGGFGVVRLAGALGGGDAESASPDTTVAASPSH